MSPWSWFNSNLALYMLIVTEINIVKSSGSRSPTPIRFFLKPEGSKGSLPERLSAGQMGPDRFFKAVFLWATWAHVFSTQAGKGQIFEGTLHRVPFGINSEQKDFCSRTMECKSVSHKGRRRKGDGDRRMWGLGLEAKKCTGTLKNSRKQHMCLVSSYGGNRG